MFPSPHDIQKATIIYIFILTRFQRYSDIYTSPNKFFRCSLGQRQKTGRCMRVYVGQFIRLIGGILTSQCMSSSVSPDCARIIHPVNRARHWLLKSRLLDQQTSNFHIHKALGQNLDHQGYNPIRHQPSQK